MGDDIQPARTTPFTWVRESKQTTVLLVLTAGMMACSIWLGALGAPLHTDAAPMGIVSFEFAWTGEHAATILNSWDPKAQAAAMFVQGLDNLYLLVYPAWFSLASLRLGSRLGSVWKPVGYWVAWLTPLAAVFDGVENHGLNEQLFHGPSDSYALLSAACAVAKFGLVGISALFLVVGFGVWIARKI